MTGPTFENPRDKGGCVPSLQEFEGLLAVAPAACMRWKVAADGFAVLYAGGNLDQFGYTPDDFTSGRVDLVEITHPEDRPRLEIEVGHCFECGMDSFSNRYRLRTAQGDYVWIQDWNRVHRGPDGTPLTVDGVMLRVSGVLEADEIGQIMLGSPSYGVVIVQDGKVAFASETACLQAGLTASELVGSPAQKLFEGLVPEDRERVEFYYAERQAGRPAPDRYAVRVDADSGPRWLELRPRRAAYNGAPAVHCLTLDITDRHEAGRALEDMRQRLESVIGERTAELEEANRRLRDQIRLKEEAVAESEDVQQYLQTVIGTSHDGILVVDAEGLFEFANDSCLRIFGFPRDDFIGAHFINMVPSDQHPFILERWEEVQSGKGRPYEVDIVTQSGERRSLFVSHRHMTIAGARKYCVVVKNVTERKRAEEEVVRYREHLEHMVHERTAKLRQTNTDLTHSRMLLELGQEMANTGSWTVELPDLAVHWSRQLHKIVGSDPTLPPPDYALRGELMHPDDREIIHSELRRVIDERSHAQVETRLIRMDGEVRDVRTRSQFVEGEGGAPDRIIGTTTDVTELRRLEKDVLDVAQHEQQRVGQDLHDTLGQELAGIAFAAKALEGRLLNVLPDAAGTARDLAEQARRSVEQCRRIAHGLAPVTIESARLGPEIEKLCAGAQELYGVPCNCRVTHFERVIDSRAASHVYQIAREALHNALRHAGASSVEIVLRADRRGGELVVVDDGEWVERKGVKGIGLRVMRHRSELIRGTFSLTHAPGTPTRVVCRFPTTRD